MNRTIEMVRVGLSEIGMASSRQSLKTFGLGSCVGVILYHSGLKKAGMAHIMLPEAAMAKNNAFPSGKFADTAVPELLLQFSQCGVDKSELKAKMAGGAEMFKGKVRTAGAGIGPRNVKAVKKALECHGVPLISEETGGHHGRTIEFFTESSSLLIRTIKGEKMI
ncbi:chemotaxis protein CheD [Scopulibacillus darangshiensis]|uniref:Probable chemoreceptor glutamine deamidase CheD n=1 Tax=Scopulibacillus darangshiensis TaxID=442528 RepID=A0A4R2P612_9BACL|nr:chemotaxis protein CheD [Scopulibacillus darangshiensis]TCP30309.1 chemotaxis protein CheD [Scopulibacillus darangshiensis]